VDLIGFGGHPYLLYGHHDAGHPHIHIVLTAIREDGSRRDFHNIGRNESETARKAIEEKYHLVKAEEQEKRDRNKVKPLNVQKLQYGKTETKRGITNVLDAVLNTYKYASLPELNAVLSLYHVRADPGEPGGRIHRNKGLLYRMIGENGKPIGKPVKASAIYSKPTLAYLEQRFRAHAMKQPADIKRAKGRIDWILVTPPATLQGFIQALKEEQIHIVLRRNYEGLIYGLTFVDAKNKAVLNGSHIGKEYTAKRLLEKLGIHQAPITAKPQQLAPSAAKKTPRKQPAKSSPPAALPPQTPAPAPGGESLLEILMRAEADLEQTPHELRVDKKKKKNRSQKL
jgi:hypothetical protein